MSYDLYFVGTPRPTLDEFCDHFQNRSHYKLQASQAWYNNDDTGVYFSFDFETADDSNPADPDEAQRWASFDINYYRPHFFADEALLELEAFVSRFGRLVSDPQNDGMGDSEFSAEGFLRGWRSGNTFAHSAIASSHRPELPPARPAAELSAIWNWNVRRRVYQGEVGEAVFVPKISFFRVSGRVCSATVWADGMSVVLPKTDIVLIYRDELAPTPEQRGAAVVSWDEVTTVLAGCRIGIDPLVQLFADYPEPPESVVRWVKSLDRASSIEGLRMADVLDAELVARFASSSGASGGEQA